MLEYLNFCLLCAIFSSILYLYIRIKKCFPILKMAEDLIGNLGYGAPAIRHKASKLLECILTGNSKLYLGKLYIEEQLAKLNDEEVEKLFNPILPGGAYFTPPPFFLQYCPNGNSYCNDFW